MISNECLSVLKCCYDHDGFWASMGTW